MGYYQSFSLCVECENEHPEDEQEFNDALLDLSKDENGNPDLEVKELIQYGGIFAKLYDLEDWIAQLAPKFPRLLIILSGRPEDGDPDWEHRWKGEEDELQYAEIPPFKNKNLWTNYENNNNN